MNTLGEGRQCDLPLTKPHRSARDASTRSALHVKSVTTRSRWPLARSHGSALRNATASLVPGSVGDRPVPAWPVGSALRELALDGRPQHIVGQIAFSVTMADVARDRIGRSSHVPEKRTWVTLHTVPACRARSRLGHTGFPRLPARDQHRPCDRAGRPAPLAMSKTLVADSACAGARVITSTRISMSDRSGVEIRPSGSGAERFEPRDTKASAQVGDFVAVVSEHR